jgi:hypothetical protein
MFRIKLSNITTNLDFNLEVFSLASSFRGLENNLLIQIMRRGFEPANTLGYGEIPLDIERKLFVSEKFPEGIAALMVLNERHGDDYCLNLFGYKKPKTILERANYFLTGRYPLVLNN